MDKYTGKRLDGRYEIHELIGVGGMAYVYRAYDTIDDRTVAIKILKDEFLGNQDFIRRFKNESKAIAVLSHPNIVKVYDVSFGDRIQYIVEEYIDGITLKEYLDQQRELKWKEAVHFTLQILRALNHAHSKGIVHRDIKPQNIMLLQDGTIKVTDFGIARFSHSETRTMTDKAIGSVHYIAPEQARGEVADERADIYSVGVMLYEMLTGTLPFEADNAVSVAIMQLQADPKPPREINPAIPEGLEEITMRAMQKNPDQRYQSASEMLEDIEAFQKNPSISFQYKYFIDEKPTKYVNAISAVRNGRSPSYNDGYDYDDYEEEPPRRRQSGQSSQSGGKGSGGNKKTMMVVLGILAAFLIVALSIGVAAIFRSCSAQPDDTMEMPDFVGKMYTDIQNSDEYQFKFTTETKEDSSKETGVILDQKPEAGMSVKKDGEVLLVVNSGAPTVNVTDVTNYLQADAEKALKDAGFKTTVLEVPDDKIAAGYVTSTEPKSNTMAPQGSTIKILVSTGPENEQIPVPNVIDKNIEAAKAEITAAGLQVGSITLQDDSDKSENTVIETNPLPGVPVDHDSKVNIVVSSGKKSEKTLEANIHLPLNVSHDIELKAYLDGTVMDDGVKTVNPAYNNLCTIKVSGTTGQKTLVIELDGSKYAVFTMDFDSGKPSQVESYPYVDPNTNTPSGGDGTDTEHNWGELPADLPITPTE